MTKHLVRTTGEDSSTDMVHSQDEQSKSDCGSHLTDAEYDHDVWDPRRINRAADVNCDC